MTNKPTRRPPSGLPGVPGPGPRSARWGRLFPVGLVLLATVVLLTAHPAAVSQAQFEIAHLGFRGPNYEASGSSGPTAEKPESKAWWNDGSWWADLYDEVSSTYHIFRLDAETMKWIDTGTQLDRRNKSRADILWDAESQKLYVASHMSALISSVGESDEQARLFRYSYDAASQLYSLDRGFPVALTPGRTQTLTIAKDSTGRLWITYVWNRMVMISHSLDNDFTWSAPTPLPVSGAITSQEDISAVVAFGGDKIGVAWTDQDDNRLDFAVHEDGAPPDVWREEIIGIGNNLADNHLNFATDSKGNVYLATKTSLKGGGEPMIMLHARDNLGIWTSHTVALGLDNQTRPVVLVDDEQELLHVFATSPTGGGAIYHKSSSTSEIDFEPGRGTLVLFYDGAPEINDVTSTKQTVNRETGVLILASDAVTKHYYFNLLESQ